MGERQRSGVGHAGGSPLPPGPRWPGTLCCWGSVPPRPDVKLSSATNTLVAVCAGSEPRARMAKPIPRAAVAVHLSKIVPKQTARHKGHSCPLPGSPRGPRAASLPSPTLLPGGPGSASSLTSDWVKPERGLLRARGLLHERVLLKWPMFITCNKATASNPSCEGECCCWHGQRGAVRAPGRGGLRDLRGGQAVAANVIGSGPTQAKGICS